ncbi:GPI-anchor transamidase [Seminavis robusta]|uniref:GPI-anchor transamidase n=1 Tax=Seminavis robusta TaxID=568900 RepID=A0A9N8DDG9_9STRA|nr:GPI-anchor transamidase [Seminavis robusta]|eukprot:Sro23_g016030.1 GPI-anchor transamidase (387) ;mRNA; f:134942-136102
MSTSSSSSPYSNSDVTNNHAVIVSSSRYWFNYRHINNALAFYQLVKANGIPDENIILFLADDVPSNARNPFKNGMYWNGIDDSRTLYDASIEIDYRGEDVTVENLVRVLLGRQGEASSTSSSGQQRRHLMTDENSNILIFLTGHGGDQFFKFQDIEEITSEEIASVLEEMHRRKRYKEILLVADTCQAFTLGDHITAPNVMVIGSSLRGESSYAHHSDTKLGLSVMERYTHAFVQFLKSNKQIKGVLTPGLTIRKAMVEPYSFAQQRAHVGFREDLMQRRTVDEVLLSDFFFNNQLLHKQQQQQQLNQNQTRLVSQNALPIRPIGRLDMPTTTKPKSTARRMIIDQQPAREEYKVELVPVYNPSDPPFLAAVVILLSFVMVLSKRT